MKTIVILFPKEETSNKIAGIIRQFHYGDVIKALDISHAIRLMNARKEGGVLLTGHVLSGLSFEKLLQRMPRWFDMVLLVTPSYMVSGPYGNLLHLQPPIQPKQLKQGLRLLLTGVPKDFVVVKEKETVVNKAKEMLMARFYLTEEQAHKFIQNRAMKYRVKTQLYAQYICFVVK